MSAIQDVTEVQQVPPTDVMVVWTRYNSAVSGGQTLTTNYVMKHHGRTVDPYILARETPEMQKVDWNVDGMEDFGWHDGLGILSASSLAQTDCPVIRLSILQQFPNASISIKQAVNASLSKTHK